MDKVFAEYTAIDATENIVFKQKSSLENLPFQFSMDYCQALN